jgi:hypothetical protein
MTNEKTMGLRQKVKRGIVSLDEAIAIAKDYNKNIQKWLKRRKDAGVVFVPEGKKLKEKRGRRKKVEKNAVV